eukprot:4123570-Prymnesium_polylepis.1
MVKVLHLLLKLGANVDVVGSRVERAEDGEPAMRRSHLRCVRQRAQPVRRLLWELERARATRR